MARIDVNFVVEKQILTQTPETYLYTGSQDYFYAIFDVDATWNNVNTIKALFIKNGVSKIVELEKCDGGYGCDIPWQMYSTTGDFKVSIYDGERMSTNSIYVVVDEKDEIEVEEPVENETYADRLMAHFSLREVDRPDTFKIDGESRTITPPDSFDNFGVESDENTNRVWFEVPQYVGDGIDLLSLNLYVNFENANGEKDKYLVKDADATDGVLYFSWLISRKATQYKGDLKFIVCAIRTDDKGEIEAEWNTTLCTGAVLEGLEVENPIVPEETSDLIDQLVSLAKSSVTTVENAVAQAEVDIEFARGQAIDDVNAARDAAVEYIGNGVDNTLSVEGKAADAKVVGDALSEKASVIIERGSGAAIKVNDSAEVPLHGMKIFGKTTQADTPTVENPQELVSVGSGGSVVTKVYEKNLFDVSAHPVLIKQPDGSYVNENGKISTDKIPLNLPYGSYTFSCDIKCPVNSNSRIRITLKDGNYAEEHKNSTGDFVHFEKSFVGEPINWNINYNATSDIGAFTIKNAQLEADSLVTEYEPYKEPQTFTFNTPNGLPGIPVSSGGNYTDENGQQWIGEKIDLARGKYIQRIYKYINTGERFAGNVFFNASTNTVYFNLALPTPAVKFVAISTHFKNTPTWREIETLPYMLHIVASHLYLSANANDIGIVGTETMGETRSLVSAWFAKTFSTENPLIVYYALETPIETDLNLTEEEIAQYKALTTHKPVTNIFNDANAHMSVEYVADTKAYIDKKIAEAIATMSSSL